MMGEAVEVTRVPNCDFCWLNGLTTKAEHDGRTTRGMWANMCGKHFKLYGIGLGTGKGQRLVLREARNV